jgi:hypothetical protein
VDLRPKWLDGLKEDFVKQMLTSGFNVLSDEEWLKGIAIDHPFAGMFLDAIKRAGVDSVLEAIRPTVERLARQSLLTPEVLLPKSIATISQNFANQSGVREASFVREGANPSKAFADSERELAALLEQMKAALDLADEEYRASYEIRVRNISEIRADFIRLKDLYRSATGLDDKLDVILEDAFKKLPTTFLPPRCTACRLWKDTGPTKLRSFCRHDIECLRTWHCRSDPAADWTR